MATKKTLELHVLTVGNIKYGLDQPVGDYTSIGDIVGVKKAAENADMDNFQTVGQLQQNALVVRFTCRLANKKVNTILCAIDKAASARGKLRGKTLAGSTIKTVTIARKRSRR